MFSPRAFIFGLSEDQGKKAVDRHCRQLFLKAESRRLGKTIMYVKGSGPIVFSDSSDDSQSDSQDDEMEGSVKEELDEEDDGDNGDNGDEEEEENKPANKRLKIA